MNEITVARFVPATAPGVFAFLSDLANHGRLANRFVEVLDLDASTDGQGGARVRVHGPLGLRRTAVTRVEHAHPPQLIVGSASIGGRTRARVSWTIVSPILDDREAATWVHLGATVERMGAVDHLLLCAGGRAWLERCFAEALVRLAHIALTEPAAVSHADRRA